MPRIKQSWIEDHRHLVAIAMRHRPRNGTHARFVQDLGVLIALQCNMRYDAGHHLANVLLTHVEW